MNAVWMRVRAEARTRWRAMLGLAVLLGIMAGGATAAAIGARRTETAYPRFYERFRAYDVGFATAGHPDGEEAIAVAAGLPQVESMSRFALFTGTVRAPSGKEATFPDVFILGERQPFSRSELKLLAGRLSDPTATDEAMTSYYIADRLGIDAGDTLELTVSSQEDPARTEQMRVRITGVFAMVGGFESATHGGFPAVVATTQAFYQRFSELAFPGEDNISFVLRRGEADIGPWVTALQAELGRRGIADAIDGPPGRASAETPGVQTLNRVPAVALWLLCGFLALTTIAVFSQLLAREIRAGGGDHAALSALGLSPRQLFTVSILRSAIVAAAGGVLAIGVAFSLSPLTPVGLARVAEPDPGFMVSPLFAGLGALATVVLVVGASFYAAWSGARHASRPREKDALTHNTFLARLLPRVPVGLSARSGLQMVVDPGRGARAVPVRTAVLGTTIAIGALAAALTFAASLDHLVGEPRLAGYSWDAGAIIGGFDLASHEAAKVRLERSIRERFRSADVWKGTVFAAASVDGIDVGVYASDGPAPSVIEGAVPLRSDEAALDARTLRRLGKRIGDTVSVAPLHEPVEDDEEGMSPPPVRVRVVGTFAVPRIGFQGTNPGQGIALTPEGYERMNPDGEYTEAVYLKFPPGADFDAGLRDLRSASGTDAFAIVNRQESATVGNVERISALPIVLAATMALLAAATLAHALTTTIRRRRRDLAIFKTIGFIERQVRSTVAWQSTALVVASLVVGLPLGIAAGRWGWRLFAQSLNVVPVPVVSTAVVAAVVAGALLLGNLIAAAPARAAARTEPALVLRTE